MSTFDRAVNPQPLLRDGSLPMTGDLDLDGNNLLGARNMQIGSVTDVSDASGDYSVTFPTAFASSPRVIVCAQSIIGRGYTVRAESTTGFTVRAYHTSTGLAAASVAARFNWWAFA